MTELSRLKCRLYLALIRKGKLSDEDVELMHHLSKDKEVQEKVKEASDGNTII